MKLPRLWYTVDMASLVPKGYGLAYRHWNKDSSVFVLMPFNLVIRGLYTLYYAILKAGYPTGWEKALEQRWNYGHEVGKNSQLHIIEMLKIKCEAYQTIIENLRRIK